LTTKCFPFRQQSNFSSNTVLARVAVPPVVQMSILARFSNPLPSLQLLSDVSILCVHVKRRTRYMRLFRFLNYEAYSVVQSN
jgi:hypothetical protein